MYTRTRAYTDAQAYPCTQTHTHTYTIVNPNVNACVKRRTWTQYSLYYYPYKRISHSMNRIIIIISSRNEYIKMYIYCVNKQKRSSGHQANKLISALKEFAVRINQRSTNGERQSNFLNKTERTKNCEIELITLSSIELKMSGNFL